MKKELALFDLDGTITDGDTMTAFIRYVRGGPRLYLSYLILSPFLLAYKLGFYPNDKAKQRLLNYHFKGEKKERMEGWGAIFGQEILHSMRRRGAMRRLRFHTKNGHEIVVVTASLSVWVEPWLRQQGIRCIATEPLWVDGRYSGKFASPNCYGPEKVNRLRAELNPDDYEVIHAYGDSNGDKELLALATNAYFRPFLDPDAEI